MNSSTYINQQHIKVSFLFFLRKWVCLFVILFSIHLTVYSQNNIGINNPTPDPSALLDLTSTTQGLLIPRMTTTERNLIPAPATSLLVYDVTLQRYMFYNGATWSSLLSNTTGWGTLGNAGLTSANFIGTTDNVTLRFRTLNIERMHIDSTGAVGIGTLLSDTKAILHILSTTRGVLLPRMTSIQRTTLIANGSALDASRDGMLVYDTNLKNFLSWNSVALRWDTILSRNNGSGLYWQLLGNTATNPAINYVGTTDSTDLVFRTNGIERFRIKANGLFYTANQGAGASNIYMGGLAGSVTSTGSNNAGFGLGSLQNNTTGSGNSALGSYALQNNTTGNENTGVGIESLRNNTTGYGNTSVGERSGFGNTTAYGNTSVGRYSIYNNQIGNENVGIGDSVLYGISNDIGDYNVAVGNRVLFRNTGIRNVGMGYRVLNNNTGGDNNVGIGTDALYWNSTGDDNVGIGTFALYNNTTGFRNVGIGASAGLGITSGDNNVAAGVNTLRNARNNAVLNNVAIGYTALFTDTMPTNNVSIGTYSMYYGNQRDANVAIGYDALRGSILVGATFQPARNVGIGTFAGQLITTGDDNVFVGTSSGRNNTSASNNVFIGNSAGFTNTTGESNVYIGDNSGYSATNASQNVFIGDHSGFLNTTGYYNSFLGYEAGRSNSIGNQNSFYGWWAGYYHTTGVANTFMGSLTGFGSTLGDGNTFIGAAAGNLISTGDRNTHVGWVANANANRLNSGAFGYGAIVTASNKIRLGDALVTVIEGQPLNYTGLSDGRFKKDLKEDVVGLDFIMKLKPVSYTFDKLAYNNFIKKNVKDSIPDQTEELVLQSKIRQSGFVAQDMEQARIAAGYESFDAVAKPQDSDDTWGIAYGTLVVPLVKSVQELNIKNIELENRNAELKSELDLLKSRLEKLEKLLEKK